MLKYRSKSGWHPCAWGPIASILGSLFVEFLSTLDTVEFIFGGDLVCRFVDVSSCRDTIFRFLRGFCCVGVWSLELIILIRVIIVTCHYGV